jgi:hypothetical protein
MSTNHSSEPFLGPDFASRVLSRADVVLAERRRTRRDLAGVAMSVVGAMLVVSGMAAFLVPKDSGDRPQVRYVELASSAASPSDPTDALGYLFPDAAPLAQFSEEYSDASENSAGDEDVLADSDTEAP